MKINPSLEKRAMSAFTDTTGWVDGDIVLDAKEIDILIAAKNICEKANEATIKLTHDEDNINSFGKAELALLDILEDALNIKKH